MNEHIKKLFDRALDQAVPETWITLSHEQITKLSEVFAELIVQECIGVVENLSPGYKDYRDQIEDAFRRDCVEEMKHKFGIEE